MLTAASHRNRKALPWSNRAKPECARRFVQSPSRFCLPFQMWLRWLYLTDTWDILITEPISQLAFKKNTPSSKSSRKKNLVKVWPQRLLAQLSLTRLTAISRLHKVTAVFVQSKPATLSFSQSCVNCQTLKIVLSPRCHSSVIAVLLKKKKNSTHLHPFSNGFRSHLLSKRLIRSFPSSLRHWSPVFQHSSPE